MEVQKTNVRKKGLGWIIAAAVLVVLIAVSVIFSVHCEKIMNRSAAEGLDILKQYYTVTEEPETEFSSMRIFGVMKFETTRYDVEGLGNLCIMKAHMGPMQMATFVLTPYDKQMPMLSTDFMYVFGSRKIYVECYDLVPDTNTEEYQGILADMEAMLSGYSDLEEFTSASGWHNSLITVAHRKKGSASLDDRFRQMFTESVETYAKLSASLEPLSEEDRAEKAEITDSFCRGMVENGGFSTNIFKKALGDEKTLEFYRTVFFGPANYMDLEKSNVK